MFLGTLKRHLCFLEPTHDFHWAEKAFPVYVLRYYIQGTKSNFSFLILRSRSSGFWFYLVKTLLKQNLKRHFIKHSPTVNKSSIHECASSFKSILMATQPKFSRLACGRRGGGARIRPRSADPRGGRIRIRIVAGSADPERIRNGSQPYSSARLLSE